MQTCDRCGPWVVALWIVWVRCGVLTFCGHCTRKHRKHIRAEGYALQKIDVLNR